MLTLKTINENPDEVIKKLAKKHFDGKDIIAKVLEIDQSRKKTQTTLDAGLAESNSLSKHIGQLMKESKKTEAEAVKSKVAELKVENKLLEDALRQAEQDLQDLLVLIPNLPSDTVPEGKTPEDNVVERMGGNIPDLGADALPHWDLAKKYDLIDFELGVKIS
ncbi:MAG: serine--tRNA ligase, partial [Prevotella sp.]|nr:serine--tRNA ligase [Prevotella sp.]